MIILAYNLIFTVMRIVCSRPEETSVLWTPASGKFSLHKSYTFLDDLRLGHSAPNRPQPFALIRDWLKIFKLYGAKPGATTHSPICSTKSKNYPWLCYRCTDSLDDPSPTSQKFSMIRSPATFWIPTFPPLLAPKETAHLVWRQYMTVVFPRWLMAWDVILCFTRVPRKVFNKPLLQK